MIGDSFSLSNWAMELLQWISKYFMDEQLISKIYSLIAAAYMFIQMCIRLQSCLFMVSLWFSADAV